MSRLNRRLCFVLVAFFVAVSSAKSQAASPVDSLTQKADQEYSNGNCGNAKDLYEKLQGMPGVTAEIRDLAEFRIGYCAYNLGLLDLAKEKFEAVLSHYPDEDEARLRLGEVQFAQEDYHEAIESAKRVRAPELLNDARILAARAYIELQDAHRALATLEKVDKGAEGYESIVDFWRGMAYFQLYDDQAAEQAFRRAVGTSPKDMWTKTAAENWIATVEDSRQWLHPRLGITYGHDDNVGQFTYKSSATSSPDTSYYISDSYYTYDFYMSTKQFHVDRASIVPSVAAYGQRFSKSEAQSYDYTSWSGDVTATYPFSYQFTGRADISYADTRYSSTFYHDYLGGNLSLIYGISKSTSGYLTGTVTQALGNSEYMTVGPTIGANGDTDLFYWLGSLSYAATTGKQATFTTSSGTTSVASGSVASSYNSVSAKGGIGRVIFWDFDLLGTVTYTQTTYAKENGVPSTAAFSTDQRVDNNWAFQVNLARSLIARRLTATLSYLYSKTDSKGFQGLEYTSGSSIDYNITRNVVSANLSYGF